MILTRTYEPVDFARMAWRRRWFIVVPFLVGLFGTLVVSSQLSDVYQSEMLIQVIPQRVPDNFVQSTVTMRTADRINALGQQVMSRAELERIIREFNLYPDLLEELPVQDVVRKMRESIRLDIVRGASQDAEAFYVRFEHTDPQTSTRVVSELGSLFIAQNAQDRGALAEGTNQFLQTQLAQARVLLEQQEEKLEQFRQSYAGRLPTQLAFNMQAMQNTQMQLQSQIESIQRDRDRKLVLERLYGDARVANEEPPASPAAPAGGQANALSELLVSSGTAGERLATAKALLVGLQARFKPEHPDIVQTERLIEDLEREAAEERELMGTPGVILTREERRRAERLREMEAEIESLGRQIEFKEIEEQRLRDVLAGYQQRIEATPGVESEWIALSRDYDTQQAAYEDLLAKSEQAKVAADLERRQVGEQFRVVDPAQVPFEPARPDRLRISIGGALTSLLLGLVIGALVELKDGTFRTERDVVDVLALPVVAFVPFVESDIDRRWATTARWLASVTGVAALAVAVYVVWLLELWRFIA